jgi:hypothetical protein
MLFGTLELLALVALKVFGVDLTDKVAGMSEALFTAIVAVNAAVILILRAVTKKGIKAPSGGLPMLLLCCLLFAVGCTCPQTDPRVIDSMETVAVTGHSQAVDCQQWQATLPVEQQATVDPYCLSLESMAGTIDEWLAIVQEGGSGL